MSESSISLSLEDLLSSGALTTTTFLLKNESSTSAPDLDIATSDLAQVQMLNAAKISLLIARAFTKYQLGAHSSTDVSSLRIEDFRIHLGLSHYRRRRQMERALTIHFQTSYLIIPEIFH